MKFGIIADIHSNLLGLKAVLDKINVDKIYCLGDIVGYYPYVNEVFDVIKENSIECILGNHDYATTINKPAGEGEKYETSLSQTLKKIDQKNLMFLKNLPQKKVLDIGEKKILMEHGAPGSFEKRIYPDTPLEEFKEISYDIIFLGHTHWAMNQKINNKLFLNPGSCGQPRDQIQASCAVFDIDKLTFEVFRTKYDISKVITKSISEGFDKRSAMYLKRDI